MAIAAVPVGATWPTSFDWRDQGKVTAIRDQGSCLSSVSFASLAALEAKIALDLSEGDLHFCSSHGANCDGWWPDEALDQLSTRGVCDESCAPYTPGTCNDCVDRSNRTVFPAGHHFYRSRDTMRLGISNEGPLIACLDCYEDLMHYKCIHRPAGLRAAGAALG